MSRFNMFRFKSLLVCASLLSGLLGRIHILVRHSPAFILICARPHIVLMIAAFTAAGAVLAGVVLQLIHPIHVSKPPAPPPPPGAPFTAVTGWDCYGGAANYDGFDPEVLLLEFGRAQIVSVLRPNFQFYRVGLSMQRQISGD